MVFILRKKVEVFAAEVFRNHEYSSGQFLERYLENLRNGRTLESTKTPAKHIKEFSQRCRMRHRD